MAHFLKRHAKQRAGDLNVVFCKDEQLLEVNRQFLNHDYYTDVITFPFSSHASPLFEAEILISAERVKENATNQSVSFADELHRVIFHGLLHLVGFDDVDDRSKKQMRLEENELLQQYARFVSRETKLI